MKKSFLSLCVAMIASAAFIFTGCSDDKEETPKAPTVEIVEIVDQTRQSVVVKYIITGENLTESGIRYADSEAGVATGTELTGTDGKVEITGLVQNKTYYVQVFASNVAGYAASEVVSFTTDGPRAVMTFLDMEDLLAYITTYDDPEVEVETLEIGGQPEGADCDVIAGLGSEGKRFPSLKGLVFSEAENIPKNAFNGSNNSAKSWLTEFSAPEAVIIKESAFIDCTLLNSIYFPKVLTVEQCAFLNITALTEITAQQFPVITSAGMMAFYTNVLEKFELPTLTTIGDYILYAANALTSVELGLTAIPKELMIYCTSLQKANFPKATEIGSKPFNYCSALVELRFASDLISIDADAFKGFDTSKCDLYITAKTAESAVDKVWQGVTWQSINII